MIIKRGYSYLGFFRNYTIVRDGEEIGSVGPLRETEINVVSKDSVLSFHTNRSERSKKYLIPGNMDLIIKVNVQWYIMLLYAFIFLVLVSGLFFEVISTLFPILAGICVILLIVHFKYFVKDYIQVNAFDKEGNKVTLKQVE